MVELGSASLETERLDQVVDVGARQLEAACGLLHVPAGLVERAAQQVRVEASRRLLERQAPIRLVLGRGSGRPAAEERVAEDVGALHLRRTGAGGADHRGLHCVRELAHVPWPLRHLQRVDQILGERGVRQAVARRRLGAEVSREVRDVLAALRERREPDRQDVEPVEEVLPERPRLDGRLQVDVRRRDHA